MKLSEVSEHNKDVTAEQIATRLVRRFEEGQRRSDGSMALHPNHERWYIADAYRLATIILGESDRRGWVCIRHRCAAHYDVPAQNANEASGSECGGCIAAERDALQVEITAAWRALGESGPVGDEDPDVATLAQAIEVSLQYERDLREQAS